MQTPMTLIRTFGTFLIEDEGVERSTFTELSNKNLRAMLLCLVAQPDHRLSATTLQDYIGGRWENAERSFANLCSKARRFIVREQGYIRLTGEVQHELDSYRFLHLLEEVRYASDDTQVVDKASIACSLYKGVFLPDDIIQQNKPRKIAEEYQWQKVAQWAAIQRRELAEAYAELMQRLIPCLFCSGQRAYAEQLIERSIEVHVAFPDICEQLRSLLRVEHNYPLNPLIPRAKAVQELEHLVATNRVSVLRGALKIGKSQLVTDAFRQTNLSHIFAGQPAYRFHFYMNEEPEAALARLYVSLMNIAAIEPDENGYGLVDDCFELLEQKRLVLILENIDEIQPHLVDTSYPCAWQMLIKKVYQEGKRSKILISTSYPQTFQHYPQMILTGLSPVEGAQLLAALGLSSLPEAERERLSMLVDGRPGLLRLIATRVTKYAAGYTVGTVQELARWALDVVTHQTSLKQYLKQTLSMEELQGILRLALIRLPLTEQLVNALLHIHETSVQRVKRSLLRSGYLLSTDEQHYRLWQVVSFYTLAHATDSETALAHLDICKALHSLLAEHTLEPSQYTELAYELVYHTLQIRDITGAANLLLSLWQRMPLISHAYRLREALVGSVDFGLPSLTGKQEAILAFYMGKGAAHANLIGLDNSVGTVSASWYYSIAWKRIEEMNDPTFTIAVGYSYTWSLIREARLQEAKQIAAQTLEALLSSNQYKYISKAYRCNAEVAFRMRNYEQALVYLDADEEFRGQHSEELQHLKGPRLSQRAIVRGKQGDYAGAIHDSIAATRFVIARGKRWSFVRAYLDAAISSSLSSGRLRAAERLLQKSRRPGEGLWSRHKQAYLNLRIAHLALLRGQWREAQNTLHLTERAFDSRDRSTHAQETARHIAETLRNVQVWANNHACSIEAVPLDCRWYEWLAEMLPLDVENFLYIREATLYEKTSDIEGVHTNNESLATGIESYERFLVEGTDAPAILHPCLASFTSEMMQKHLYDIHSKLDYEFNAIVRVLYKETVAEGLHEVALLDAAKQGNATIAQQESIHLYGAPSPEQVGMALGWVCSLARQAITTSSYSSITSTQANLLLSDPVVHHSLVQPQTVYRKAFSEKLDTFSRTLSREQVQEILQAALSQYALDNPQFNWQVQISDKVENVSVCFKQKRLLIPVERECDWTPAHIRAVLAHEVEERILRYEAGQKSCLKLLGIGLQNYVEAEEVFTPYGFVAPDMPLADEEHIMLIAMGLALGILDGVPRSFRAVFMLVRAAFYLYEHQTGKQDKEDELRLHKAGYRAYRLCLRMYRGGLSPDMPLWCYTKDYAAIRGRRSIAHTLRTHKEAYNQRFLNLLRAGRISLKRHHLAALQDLNCCTSVIEWRNLSNDAAFLQTFKILFDS